MSKPRVISTILFLMASVSGICLAADMFDDFEQTFQSSGGKKVSVKFYRMTRTVPTSFSTPELPNPFPATKPSDASDSTPSGFYYFMRAFSEPIRLSIENSIGVSNRGQSKKLP